MNFFENKSHKITFLKMKYAIYGAGSLGIVLAAKLRNATGEEVIVIDRNPKSVDALNKNGAIVVGTTKMTEKITAILDTNVEDKYDIIFLMTKQLGNKETVQKISHFLTKEGIICTMQNGLPEQEIADIIGAERTFGCAVGWGATRLEPGVSELTSPSSPESLSFNIGSYSGSHSIYLDEIKRILSYMGNVSIDENFIGGRWAKILINSALSGTNAVCGSTFGDIVDNKGSREIILRVFKEGINVAHSANIKIEKIQGKDLSMLLDYHNSLMKQICYSAIIPIGFRKVKKLKASMLQDIEKGIPTEVDYINGIVCNFGKKYNCPTPFNDKIVEIIHKVEKKELSPSFDNIKLFDDIVKSPEKGVTQINTKVLFIVLTCIIVLVICLFVKSK